MPSETAVAYLRTSSAANVGNEKDSATRQRAAIQAFANATGLTIVHEYYDAAVSGADRIDARPGFAEMIAYMNSNGARTILVESASRFARDLIVQETGYRWLKDQGFTLIAVDDPDAFTAETPTAVLIRQILGAVSQFEKANLVSKLKGARDRKSASVGRRVEGRKGYTRGNSELCKLAKELNETRTLHETAAELARRNSAYTTASGKPFSASQVKRLVEAVE
jgi:DNA invertase Pin-like site-specific DNA recombinase